MSYCNCGGRIVSRTVRRYRILRHGVKYDVEKVQFYCSECGKVDSTQEYETEV